MCGHVDYLYRLHFNQVFRISTVVIFFMPPLTHLTQRIQRREGPLDFGNWGMPKWRVARNLKRGYDIVLCHLPNNWDGEGEGTLPYGVGWRC